MRRRPRGCRSACRRSASGLRLDALSAFFGLVVNIGVAAASIYGLGLDSKTELTGRIEPMFPAFAAAMNLVLHRRRRLHVPVLLGNDVARLLAAGRRAPRRCRCAPRRPRLSRDGGDRHDGAAVRLRRAGGRGGRLRLRRRSAPSSTHRRWPRWLVLAAIVGAGSKAGIMPLHAWLPLAHPAAPSHVSALMSGVMTKVAIYGLDPHRVRPRSVAPAMVVVAAVHPARRGDGGRRPAARRARPGPEARAGLFDDREHRHHLRRHRPRHRLQDGGSAGSRRRRHGGGPAARAQPFLVQVAAVPRRRRRAARDRAGATSTGSAGSSIACRGRRPASWSARSRSRRCRRSTVSCRSGCCSRRCSPGPRLPEPILRFLSPAIGAMLALAAGLAAACFVRAFGIAFLGRPRSASGRRGARGAVGRSARRWACSRVCASSAACSAALIVRRHRAGARRCWSAPRCRGRPTAPTPFSLVAFDAARSIYDAPTIAVFVAIRRARHRRRACIGSRTGAPGGHRRGTAAFPIRRRITQYTASSFAQPLRRVYGGHRLLGARDGRHAARPARCAPARLEVSQTDHIWRWLYAAPAAAVWALSSRLNAVQFLTIRRYLVLMFLALVILLVVAAAWI